MTRTILLLSLTLLLPATADDQKKKAPNRWSDFTSALESRIQPDETQQEVLDAVQIKGLDKLTDAQLTVLRKYVKTQQVALREVSKILRAGTPIRPERDWSKGFEMLLPELGSLRGAAGEYSLLFQLARRDGTGDGSDALRDGCLLGGALSEDRAAIGQLVRISVVRTFVDLVRKQMGSVGPETAERWRAALPTAASLDGMFGGSMHQEAANLRRAAKDGSLAANAPRLARPFVERDARATAALLERMANTYARPLHRTRKERAALTAEAKAAAKDWKRPVAQMFLPAMGKMAERQFDQQIALALLREQLRLEAIHARKKAYPASTATTDPATGTPLTIKGGTLVSAGRDGKAGTPDDVVAKLRHAP